MVVTFVFMSLERCYSLLLNFFFFLYNSFIYKLGIGIRSVQEFGNIFYQGLYWIKNDALVHDHTFSFFQPFPFYALYGTRNKSQISLGQLMHVFYQINYHEMKTYRNLGLPACVDFFLSLIILEVAKKCSFLVYLFKLMNFALQIGELVLIWEKEFL